MLEPIVLVERVPEGPEVDKLTQQQRSTEVRPRTVDAGDGAHEAPGRGRRYLEEVI